MACELCDRWSPTACDKCGTVVPTAFVAIETQGGAPIDDPKGFMWCVVCHSKRVDAMLRERATRAEAALREWQLGIGDTEMEAENKRLRAELDTVKAERTVALRDIVHLQSAARALGERGGSANTPAQQAHRDRVMGHGRPRLPEITDVQIEAVRGDAAQACNTSLIALCNRALAGSARARRRCRQMLRDSEVIDY